MYEFGNGCDESRTLALSQAHVVARVDGAEVILAARDGAARHKPASLEAYRRGTEVIRYDPPAGNAPLGEVCVDLRGLARGPDDETQRVCLAASEGLPIVDVETPGLTQATDGCIPSDGSHPDGCSPGDSQGWDAWMPFRLTEELDLSYRSLRLTSVTLRRGDASGISAAPLGARVGMVGGGLRVPMFLTKHMYTGFEVGLAGGETEKVALEPSAAPTSGGILNLHFGGLLGMRFVQRPTWQLRGEAILAARAIFVGAADSSQTSNEAYRNWATLVEPRLRLDVWVLPTVSVSAWGGADVAHPGDWVAGLALGLHARSFDAP